jgi:predicted nucleotidyltransferase
VEYCANFQRATSFKRVSQTHLTKKVNLDHEKRHVYTQNMPINKQKLNDIKHYFTNRDDVVMAFLFGSQSKAHTRKTADWDIGVYFKPTSRAVEWEADKIYPQKNKVWGDVIKLLKTDTVDLVVLNRAPASIADSIIKGLPLVIKNRTSYLKFLLTVTNAATDYRTLVDEYYEIFERSKSLSEEDKLILKKRLMFLEQELSDFPAFKNITQRQFGYYENASGKQTQANTRNLQRNFLVNAIVARFFNEIGREICWLGVVAKHFSARVLGPAVEGD